ncbi:hypothetical protein CDD80_3754 [Ophiocordyceps camponoti-rufipedis]|uniref:Uncharacterized protein n=1 Tax=Ophiocordyceps camponoti-rufipedis TaxID=2004952 RepID=A0A2C5Z146_9HYPO|nr:hypothetical protein CDD80_3754 [Ophiocordyceps camponoti-rufipedis]
MYLLTAILVGSLASSGALAAPLVTAGSGNDDGAKCAVYKFDNFFDAPLRKLDFTGFLICKIFPDPIDSSNFMACPTEVRDSYVEKWGNSCGKKHFTSKQRAQQAQQAQQQQQQQQQVSSVSPGGFGGQAGGFQGGGFQGGGFQGRGFQGGGFQGGGFPGQFGGFQGQRF